MSCLLTNSWKKMVRLPSIIAILRHCALNYTKYITTQHKQFLVIYLYVTITLIYNTRAKSDFIIPQINTVLKGSNSIRYYGPVIWNSVPAEIKYVNSLQTFKNKIRM